ncbi:transporter substrate-binding domain-containing protein [Terrirubrum flagellatum]|uniref:transporter substrate-binding domain-containing protein n=1 Tax=Terrirubrum flagellatum TaxID=2895980 RepID=UPI003CC834AF
MNGLPEEQMSPRRDLLKLGALAAGAAAFAGTMTAQQAAAQAPAGSTLRTVLSRGKLIVGTGSTNAPWHFEDEKGQLTGMDITIAQILARGLFDDVSKIEFVRQEPAARIPNLTTGKVDCVIQFMTVSPARAQLVNFSRPYYVEGVALLTSAKGKYKTHKELTDAGSAAKASVLQNVDADTLVKKALPQAQVLQLDTQANVIQALDSGRADAAIIDLSTVGWLVKRNPDKYLDSGFHYETQLYSIAMRQGDLDWLSFVNTTLNVNMHGHQTDLYDKAFQDFFGAAPPRRTPGFPVI